MKVIGKVSVQGVTKRVILATPEEAGPDALGENDHASHDGDTNIIWLNRAVNVQVEETRDNIFHEMTHAWLLSSGVRFYLQRLLEVSDEEWDLIEEDIVRMLSPAIASSFEDLKKLFSTLAKKIGTLK